MSAKDYGRYTLLKKLATGGMAEVFLARQKGVEGFEKLCVIKRILPHLADDAEFVTMFLNEARIAARFGHPNIAQIFDLGREEGTYYIAMEYVHGEDLGRIMRQAWASGTWLPLPVALRIVAQACEGLYYAHTKTDERGQPMKVVHRDVSPANVLVSFEGSAKIVDFGIARAADQVSTTRSGAIKGKFAYMSPEQAGGKAVDARSDQFAVGLVLYEMITGVRPFKRDSDILTLKAAVDCIMPPPSQVAELPKDLDPIVLKSLARLADDRYPDARGLQMAIESYIVQKGWTVTSGHVAEFMRELFADRLKREAETGEPMVSDSQTGAPMNGSGSGSLSLDTGGRTGSFPMPKKLPTRPEFMAVDPGASGPPGLNPAALSVSEGLLFDAMGGALSEPRRTSTGAQKRKATTERPSLVPGGKRPSGVRPAVSPEVRPSPAPKPDPDRPARRPSRIQPIAEPGGAEEPLQETRRSGSGAPAARTRTSSSERKRKSVLYMDEVALAEQDLERAAQVKQKSFLADEDDEDEATEARLSPVRKPLPRWPLLLLVVAAIAGVMMLPGLRAQVMAVLQSAKAPDDFQDATGKTALFLESNVAVDVWLGTEKLGTTPLEGHLVPEGTLKLRLENANVGVQKEIVLQAKGSTLRHKEQFAVGRVTFRADNDCEVYIAGRRVARAPGPPLDFFEGNYQAECRNENLGLVGFAKLSITKAKPADLTFKLKKMEQ